MGYKTYAKAYFLVINIFLEQTAITDSLCASLLYLGFMFLLTSFNYDIFFLRIRRVLEICVPTG